MDDETLAAIDLAVEGDEQLLREALEALKLEERCMTHISPCPKCFTSGTGPCEEFAQMEEAVVLARQDAITKLEQRLLEE